MKFSDTERRLAEHATSGYIFAIFSGVGWLLDLAVFATLATLLDIPAGISNFVSSTVGATFAFVAFGALGRKDGNIPNWGQVATYTGYQLVSITIYSFLVSAVVAFDWALSLATWVGVGIALLAKALVTPLNFLTNFVASQTILSFVRPSSATAVPSLRKIVPEEASMDNPRVLVFIPCYNCERQIPRVLNQFNAPGAEFVDRVMIVDNHSTDGTVAAATTAASGLSCDWVMWRNKDNYGLGGSHKAAMAYAEREGFDYLVVLHGDDQADIRDLFPLLKSGEAFKHDCFLGSRFAKGARLSGYSALREFGNRIYNLLFSIGCGHSIADLGSGLNLYRVKSLRLDAVNRMPDDLTFNYGMLMWSLYQRHSVGFFPISWREDDQVSNVRLVRQASKVLSMLCSRVLMPRTFFGADHREIQHEMYTGDILDRSS